MREFSVESANTVESDKRRYILFSVQLLSLDAFGLVSSLSTLNRERANIMPPMRASESISGHKLTPKPYQTGRG